MLLATALLVAPLGAAPSAAPALQDRDAARSAADVETVRPGVGARLDAWLAALVPWGFSGTVLAARDGEVLLAKGYGKANRARGTPMAVDSVISTGSITKQFTAAAILALEIDGRLSVADPITEFFEDVPPDKRDIRIFHLLTHTAGLRSDFAETDFSPVGRDEYVRRALASELLFPPGGGQEYANSGYSLLGAIVERVSGRGYEEFLAERLFAPAGMRDTGYRLPGWAPARVAKGYDGDVEWGTVLERPWASDGPWWGLRANGGIHSTIGDVWRWHLALGDDRVLPAEQRMKLFVPHVVESGGSGWHYGFGWAIAKTARGTKLVTHNGSNGVFFADLLRFVDEDAVLYVATNARPHAGQVTGPLEELLFGGEVAAPPELVELGAAELAAYAGDWTLAEPADGQGEVLRVTAADGALALTGDGPRAFALALRGDPDAGRHDARVERMRHMFEGALVGEWKEMYAAFGVAEPLERFVERHRGFHERWRAEVGELRDFVALGASAGRPTRTWLRLDFERGSRWLEFLWGPDGVRGFGVLERPPRRVVRPAGADRFVAWDLERGIELELAFERGADGRPARLVVNGGTAAVRADAR